MTQLAREPAAVSQEVSDFAERESLTRHLRAALELARVSFGPDAGITASLELDPETDERRIVVDVRTPAGVDEALDRNRRFVRGWVSATPPDVRTRIRMLFDVV